MLGVFLAFDLLLFYVCFELTLIPLLFLIGGWGPGPNRRDAARKLFLFTLAGGLFTLLGVAGIVLFVYSQTGEPNQPRVLTFSIPRLADIVQQSCNQNTNEPTRGLWHRRKRICSSRWRLASRSRFRSCRCTRGCPVRTPRHRPA